MTEGQTVVTTDYVIDPNNPTGYAQVVEEWTAGATPNLARSFVIGHSILSQWTDQTSQVLFLLADGHGSTQMVVNAAGAIVESYDYDANGNLINPPASPLTSHLYTGPRHGAVPPTGPLRREQPGPADAAQVRLLLC